MSGKPFEDMGYVIAFGLIICFVYWPLGVSLVALGLLGVVYLACDQVYLEEAAERHAATVAIIERADRQHAAALSGDPYGIYGEYPPAA